MATLDEKQAFAARLKQALKRSPKRVETPAELALQFNLRNKSDSISPQAAQKWLSGQARPTPDKIATLAEWLTVSAQWLRYGIAEERPQAIVGRKALKTKLASVQPTEEELKLLARLRSLSEHKRFLVLEVLEQFVIDNEIWRD